MPQFAYPAVQPTLKYRNPSNVPSLQPPNRRATAPKGAAPLPC